MFLAKIRVTLKSKVNDPQGHTVLKSLRTLGFSNVTDVRIGKYIEVCVDEVDEKKADHQICTMCDQLLANTVIEEFQYDIEPI